MKITKLLLTAVVALGLGFTACSNDDEISSNPGEKEANTNVSVTLNMSLNSVSGEKSLPEDYNYIGEWAGKDKIEKVAVYLIDGTTVSSSTFTVGSAATDGYTPETNGGQVILRPKKAIRTTAGIKKVYVLINGTTDVETALSATPADVFENAYKTAALKLNNSGANLTVSTSADKLAVKNGTDNERIVMTSQKEETINVVSNVNETDALIDGNPNKLAVSVERSVARVMVTTLSETYQLRIGADLLGTVSDISWVLAQGENSLFIQHKANFSTPNFTWKPANDAEYWAANGAESKYDYSGLFENYNATTQFGGTAVATMADYATNPKDKITEELETKLSGKFILPNTHAYGAGDASSYRKGNTAYVLIRAKFTPAVLADGETYTEGNDFFVGANGKFYKTPGNALDPDKGGVNGQKVAKYVGGKVLYYAWVNPDNVPDWYNSPVVRNNVYHIHITGFKNLGTNWNPLFPEDPDNPKGDKDDPENPGKKIPLNPDPRPKTAGVEEPENPIDPEDPLTTPETWMSVQVRVLPWIMHSYAVDLGI